MQNQKQLQLKRLWIMRHGLAKSEFDSDFTRELSGTGRRQAESVAKQIKADAELPLTMMVSPFTRTQQTAEIVQPILGLSGAFETDDLLVHYADPQVLASYLLASKHQELMIVSHMPIVARLCQILAPECEIFGMQTAQVARIEFDSMGKGQLSKSYFPE